MRSGTLQISQCVIAAPLHDSVLSAVLADERSWGIRNSLLGQCVVLPVDDEAARRSTKACPQNVIERIEVASPRLVRNKHPADFLEKPLQGGESRAFDLVSHGNAYCTRLLRLSIFGSLS